MSEPLYPVTKEGSLSLIADALKALDRVEKEHVFVAHVLRVTIKVSCELLVFILEDPGKDRRELLAACRAALPVLRWANIHGSRCEELITQVESAVSNAVN